MTDLNFDQLEEDGYTVVPGFMDRETTSRIRRHIDSLLPPVGAPRQDPKRWHSVLRHPIPGAIMAELVNNPALLALARQCLRPRDLRLLEQVLIRSDPRPPPHGPTGWHVDWTFLPCHYEAVPRQTYFHMVHCLNTVPPGGAAFMIVPGSQRLAYKLTAELNAELSSDEPSAESSTAVKAATSARIAEELGRFKRDPAGVAGIDTDQGIEICPQEGDLLVFNPMALHSASGNATQEPRYVYFASFFDATAVELRDELRRTKYRDGFPDSLRQNLPEELLPLLEW
jgi:ectoine hydroxylase-related dioxygenase (phytanoyl-CoA dioxygenase family)